MNPGEHPLEEEEITSMWDTSSHVLDCRITHSGSRRNVVATDMRSTDAGAHAPACADDEDCREYVDSVAPHPFGTDPRTGEFKRANDERRRARNSWTRRNFPSEAPELIVSFSDSCQTRGGAVI